MFTKEFKLAAVRRLEQGVTIGEAARAWEVNPNVLHRGRREFRTEPGNAFPGNGKQCRGEGRIAELERKIGQQALEIDFLKGCACSASRNSGCCRRAPRDRLGSGSHDGRRVDLDGATQGAVAQRLSSRGSFIIPIAAPSTPATTTRNCSWRTASTSACRARRMSGTTRLANLS